MTIHTFLMPRGNIVMAGAGGTGSQMLTGLARMAIALRSLGLHEPHVSVYDPDTVSPSNIGRQLFSEGDVGQFKVDVLVNRINLYFGLEWDAIPSKFIGAEKSCVIVGCVDNRASRKDIYNHAKQNTGYWLDLGNGNTYGQAILGNTDFGESSWHRRKQYALLPTVADLYPEMIDDSVADPDDTPSCSLAEALEKQDLLVNQTVATHALEILWQLFRHGEIRYHGFFFDVTKFSLTPLSVDPKAWKPYLKKAVKYNRRKEAA